MSKMPIEWHKIMLVNQKVFMEEERIKVKRALASFKKTVQQTRFYEEQIECAKKEGKDGFDSERYMVVRKK